MQILLRAAGTQTATITRFLWEAEANAVSSVAKLVGLWHSLKTILSLFPGSG